MDYLSFLKAYHSIYEGKKPFPTNKVVNKMTKTAKTITDRNTNSILNPMKPLEKQVNDRARNIKDTKRIGKMSQAIQDNRNNLGENLWDQYMEMYVKDLGRSMSYKVTPNEKKPSTKKKPMSSDRQKKLDNMISRGTPNERAVAKRKLSGPSLPNLK